MGCHQQKVCLQQRGAKEPCPWLPNSLLVFAMFSFYRRIGQSWQEGRRIVDGPIAVLQFEEWGK